MSTFSERTQIERQALGYVNSRLPLSQRLHGLSASAIASWRDRAPSWYIDGLEGSLTRLASLVELLASRSGESLEFYERGNDRVIEQALTELAKAVRSLASQE